MSQWDETRSIRGQHAEQRRFANASFPYTYFFPSMPRRFAHMLISEEKLSFTVADIYDLARFVEDFVLCDHVGLPRSVYEEIGPYFLSAVKHADDLPLFDSSSQLRITADGGGRIDEYQEAFNRERVEEIRSLVESTRLESPIDDLLQELPIRHDHPPDDSRMKEALTRIYADTSPLREQILPQVVALFLLYQRRAQRARLVILGCGGDKLSQREFDGFAVTLCEWSQACGVSISPNFAMRSRFWDDGRDKSLAGKLYAEVASVHKEQLGLIEKWTKPRAYELPPLLSILMGETANRSELVKALVGVREQFAGLRKKMRETSAALSADGKFEDKLEIVWGLESAREQILRAIKSRRSTSIVRRTWNIVKSRSLWGGFTALADVALDIDEERRFIGGIRHFIELERLALEVRESQADVRRLFGEIAEAPRFDRRSSDDAGASTVDSSKSTP